VETNIQRGMEVPAYFYVKNVHGLDMDWAFKTYSSWICEASIRPYLCAGYFGGASIGHSFVGGGTILKWIR
jgi:hypothetical protein